MLDLQPRVHLEEVEPAVLVEQELDRAGVGVADRRAPRPPPPRSCAARSSGVDGERRRLLDDLLMPALDRAFALDERQHRAVLIAEQLHLDVARPRRAAARDTRRHRQTRRRLPSAPRAPRRQVRAARSTVRMPLPPPPDDGLDEQRIADRRARARADLRVATRRRASGSAVPGTTGTPARAAAARAAVLLPISAIASGVGPMNVSPASRTARGERLVLREKSVAGMHRVGARSPRGVEDRDRCAGSCRAARSARSA